MTKKEIGRAVKNRRVVTGKTFYQITKESDVQRLQVVAIEKGDKAYTIDSLLNTCKVLGMEINLLDKSEK